MAETLNVPLPARPEDGARGLIAFALDNLRRMQTGSGLFCHEVVAGDPSPRGESLRYTLMTYIGLLKADATGHAHDFDLEHIGTVLRDRLDAPELRPGDYGLHLWADAVTGGERREELLARLQAALGAGGGLVAREGMEIGWIVQGLALQAAAGFDAARGPLDAAVGHALSRAHAGSGLFEHRGQGARRRFPNFATQIYSVLALATVAKLGLDDRAAAAGQRAAERLHALQLPDGGWPWLFDVRSGRVVERYEIYTVHQTAMAPMGLLQLFEATGDRSHVDAVLRGVHWIHGGNDLGVPMLDAEEQILCRSIRRRRPWSRAFLYGNTAASALTGAGRAHRGAGTLELNRTDRPYHLGWLLEAWCGREDLLA